LRNQPSYLPSKEEIQQRIKELRFLRDSELSEPIVESCMVWGTPTFEEVFTMLQNTRKEEAELLLFDKVHPKTKSLRKNKNGN
jgi:hypothetical protein